MKSVWVFLLNLTKIKRKFAKKIQSKCNVRYVQHIQIGCTNFKSDRKYVFKVCCSQEFTKKENNLGAEGLKKIIFHTVFFRK